MLFLSIFGMFYSKNSFRKLFICLIFAISGWNCSALFVNKIELARLKKKFTGIYKILRPVDIGNNRKANVGDKVKLYFISTSQSIKVYAYPYAKSRETALGDNILYLFEDDFPNEAWISKIFEKKLLKIVKKIK